MQMHQSPKAYVFWIHEVLSSLPIIKSRIYLQGTFFHGEEDKLKIKISRRVVDSSNMVWV